MLESYLEKQIVEYAKYHGWWVSKMIDASCRGAPDRRMIWPKTGLTVHVEIKQPGGRLSKVQKEYHKKLKKHHQIVWTVDSMALFIKKLKGLEL